ncbi:impB/mucB/samB family protein, partial [Salmonella enterica subsp. enterica serovar Kentucky]|nr:impB/mucB/samB family protein [Salmonella enterica subsp. enterica serovar Kentucky]EAO6033289.1 impB/mucB/samB family protein [Salmonella enterica]EBF9373704.1 impB/mucB/samB family protein [Salmonella enterica subsp. enterica serovar Berta]EBG6764959.1 impB/mucB/samB family protein [Salmonella enterica subsp. enterica]EBK1669900.1 impB/mucB/samB family protein [Salmonella enterica subsp. enterica serovar Newport]EBL6044093.1 impB/mucB/samB family protein [Salmonella enterica subsp. enteri
STPRFLTVMWMRTISRTALLCLPTLLAVHFWADCTQR